jgi:hypothetical protein
MEEENFSPSEEVDDSDDAFMKSRPVSGATHEMRC